GLLQPYPFEKLRGLLAGITPPKTLRPISLGLGEPQHPTPQLLKEALAANLDGMARYPLTLGLPELRETLAEWIARRHGLPALDAKGDVPDWDAIPESTWKQVRLLYTCSPNNPTGRVMGRDEWKRLFELSDRHGFVIVSDECYSEVYFDESAPPVGALRVAHE